MGCRRHWELKAGGALPSLGGIMGSPHPGAPHSCTVSEAGFPVPDEGGEGCGAVGDTRNISHLRKSLVSGVHCSVTLPLFL